MKDEHRWAKIKMKIYNSNTRTLKVACYLQSCIKCLLQLPMHLKTEKFLHVSPTYLSKFFSFVRFPGLPKVCQELLLYVCPAEFQLKRSPPILPGPTSVDCQPKQLARYDASITYIFSHLYTTFYEPLATSVTETTRLC